MKIARSYSFALVLLASALATFSSSQRAGAAAIGGVSVHFNSEGYRIFNMTPGNSFLQPTDSAGVVPLTHWNNTNGYFGGPTSLTDSAGAATSATVTWTSSRDQRFTSGHTGTDGNSKMTNGEFEDETNLPQTVSISGVPYPKYDVYIYVGTDVNGRKGNGTFTPAGGTAQTVFFISNDGYTSSTFQGFVQATGTSDANSIPSNYLVFHDVTSPAFTYVQQKSVGEIGGIGIHGIEIVAVPEPGSALLLGGSALGLLLRNRPRKI